ncbi:MAG: Trk system potassium transporter TrkA [Clostridiales bacterium]|uniref:Trk system potassium uptake protein TrkA n=1 Tax=Harryflintia acetispora TaxID=1849041 RepID=A0A9X8UIY1_9FIRM|nr:MULTISPECIES: Trk system potassium transporter TrkA [Oscillospiraceae]PWM36552.1 MAG: Trk system potassium transporter TrkA [Clostridiales bacterium]RGB65905.1 Trk system potassium transporter TrkA [Harryflintia acetispora]TCL42999.1 trk system potassium uptake protein TrkA [Harryflintia acetispora]
MRIIIVGLGKVGLALTAMLSREGHDLVVVDCDPVVLQNTQETFDVIGADGNGAALGVLREAGAEFADLIIAVTGADEINLLSCVTAKKLGCAHTIARVRNPEYVKQLSLLKEELGLSMVINPEDSAAREISHILQFPSFIKRESFAKGRVEIVGLKIRQGCTIIGKPLSELYRESKVKVLVCAVEREDEVFIPDGNFVIRAGDKIHVTAETNNLAGLIKYLGIPMQKVRDVVLIGGSKIAFYLARRLIVAGISVKIIEKEYERCVKLSEQLPRALVINGDGCAQKLLDEEINRKADAVVALLNIDEANLVVSMYLSGLGVPIIVAKIDRTEYMDVYKNFGLESIISPKGIICNDVLQYVRALCNSAESSVITLYRLVNDQVEALEFRAAKDTRYLGVPLAKAPIRKGVLIACLKRGSTIIFPSGDDSIQLGDTVIAVTSGERTIGELNDIYH